MQNNDESSECLVYRLGNLQIQSVKNEKKENSKFMNKSSIQKKFQHEISLIQNRSHLLDNEKSFYEVFNVELQSIKMQYFSSISCFRAHQLYQNSAIKEQILQNPLLNKLRYMDVIEEFSIALEVMIIKKFIMPTAARAKTKINARINNIKVNLTNKLYADLLNLMNCFTKSRRSQQQDLLQDKKHIIQETQSFGGYLKKRNEHNKIWSFYYVIFSGAYLYFYLDPSQEEYMEYLYVKDCKIEQVNRQIGIPYSFRIIKKVSDKQSQSTYLAAESYYHWKDWMKIFKKKLMDYKSNPFILNIKHLDEKIEFLKNQEIDIQQMTTNLSISQLQIVVSDGAQKKILELFMGNFDVLVVQKNLDFQMRCSLENFFFRDFLQPGAPEELQNVVSCCAKFLVEQQEQGAPPVIDVQYSSIQQSHPLYKGEDSQVAVNFAGELRIIWKPMTVKYVLDNFINAPPAQSNQGDHAVIITSRKSGFKPESQDNIFAHSPQTNMLAHQQQVHFKRQLTYIRTDTASAEEALLAGNRYKEIVSTNLRIKVQQMDLIMIHQPCAGDQTQLAHLQMINLTYAMKFKAAESTTDAAVEEMHLFDMSNYPHTKQQINLRHRGMELISGRAQKNSADPFMRMTIHSLDPDSKKIQNFQATLFELEVTNLELLYYHQLNNRIISYYQREIMDVIYGDYAAREEKSGFVDHKQLLKTVTEPQLTNMQIRLRNPRIMLRHHTTCKEYLQLDFKDVTLYNSQQLSPGRIDGQPRDIKAVWVQFYTIKMSELVLSQFRDAHFVAQLSEPMTWSMRYEQPLFLEEYRSLFKNFASKQEPRAPRATHTTHT